MKSVEELTLEVIKKVRQIDLSLPISNEDIACIAGITMAVMYEEDNKNKIDRINKQTEILNKINKLL